MTKKAKEKIHYDEEMEELFIRFFLSDPELFVRCKAIIDPRHYNDIKHKKAVEFMIEHADNYSALPTIAQLRATVSKQFEKMHDIAENHKEWLLDTYEGFARHRQMELVILSSPDLLVQGLYGTVEKNIKEAMEIALVKDLGTDYFYRPDERLEEVKRSRGAISTGWATIDEKLYGGLNRGEITIFAGQSGAGKSLFLQNMAVNWAELGLNVVYITLELSEILSAMRLDAMITGYGTREVLKNSDDVALRVSSFHKKHPGSIQIKQLKNGCTANDIKAYVKEYEIQSGRKVDAILVDYLDLMMPMGKNVSASDLFVKDKYVSEELRNCAIDLDVLMVTASQLNRSSHETVEFDHSHISGGISKINTADNVIGIFVTQTMKDNGRYQVQFLKTRSSSGVGSRVDLTFNIKCLRISDLIEGSDDNDTVVAKSVVSQLANAGSINKDTLKKPPQNSGDSAKPKEKSGDKGTLAGDHARIQDMLRRRTAD